MSISEYFIERIVRDEGMTAMGGDRMTEFVRFFGGCNRSGFGTAACSDSHPATTDVSLERWGLERWEYFLGDQWTLRGPDVWQSHWKLVYKRLQEQTKDILKELQEHADRATRLSVGTMLEGHEDAEQATVQFTNFCNDPAVEQLEIYRIGDGEALSGVLVAASGSDFGKGCLIFLLD